MPGTGSATRRSVSLMMRLGRDMVVVVVEETGKRASDGREFW